MLGVVVLEEELLVRLVLVVSDALLEVVAVLDVVELNDELVEVTTGHFSTFTTLVSSVTEPLNANTPPLETAKVVSVTEADARMLP
jgi:hypothetical protein